VFSAFRSPWPNPVARVLEPLLDLLAPRECAACGEAPERARIFCERCGEPGVVGAASIAGVPLVVAGAYEPPLSLAIGRFKFEGHSELAENLAVLVETAARHFAQAGAELCAPVPLHPKRLAERGYDQAALLARAIARSAGLGFAPRLLERARATDQQARLGRDARSENVRGAFRVAPRSKAARVVLVDDVVTTGATLAACIEVLKAKDCEVAGALALARAGT
jgi:ComF family protein